MNSPILTDNGRELLNRTLANKGIIKFSKMTISDNQIPKLSASIVGYNYNKENVYVVSSFTNENLATSFIVKILNIYAIDTNTGTEILYATSTNTTGDTFNSKDLGFQKKIYELYVGFSNSSQITIEINPSIGSEYTDNVREQIGIEAGTFINLQNGFNGGLLLKELQGKSVQNGTPTPDNKVDIVSVGDNGSVVAKVTGKNLLDYRIYPTSYTAEGLTFTRNIDGSFTINGTPTNAYVTLARSITLQKGKYYISCGKLARSEAYVQLSYTEDGTRKYINNSSFELKTRTVCNVSIQTGNHTDALNNYVLYPQIELGATSSSYEQYKEQLITIPLTQPLRSVGSVYDRIIKKDGIWGVERKFTTKIFDGSESDWHLAETLTNTLRFGTNKLTGGVIRNSINKMSDRFKITLSDDLTDTEHIRNGSYGYPETIILYINKSRLATQDLGGFKAWLSANPITVVYELATPTFEPFSQSLQDQLNKLQTYQGVTNVFTTDALQPNIIVEYGKTDTSALSLYGANVCDNKVDKSSVANNLITTVEGTVLDGRQGKALNDKIGNLSDLTTASKTDLVGAVNEVKASVDVVNNNLKLETLTPTMPEQSNYTVEFLNVFKKSGWCFIKGQVTVATTSTALIQLANNIPIPEVGSIFNWTPSANGQNVQAVGIVIDSNGLRMRYGETSKIYQFEISYPCS